MSAFTELIDPPPAGRVFREQRRAALGDCAPSGRMRLDALARWLQDVAFNDVDDAGVADDAVWVVRRNRIRVTRFPRFGERCELATFCSGVGRAWAERRTSVAVVGSGESVAESVSLWVHLDPRTWMPAPFTEREIDVYGETAGDRRISARLRHPRAPAGGTRSSWTFRLSEADIAQHVNNAAYWTVLDEDLLHGPELDRLDVEIEFRAPAQPGEKTVITAGGWRWIVSEDGQTNASIVIGGGT